MDKIRAMAATAAMTGAAVVLATAPAAAEGATPRCDTYPVDGKPAAIHAPTDADKVVLITDTGDVAFFDVSAGQYLDGGGAGILAITKCFLDPAAPDASPGVDETEPDPTAEPDEPASGAEATEEPAQEPEQPTPEPEPEVSEAPDPDASAPDPVEPEVDDAPAEGVDNGDEDDAPAEVIDNGAEDEAHVDDEPVVFGPEPLDEEPTEPAAPRTEASPAAPRVQQDTLAYTGSETPLLAGTGAGLLLVGAAMTWAGRRRMRTASATPGTPTR